MRKSTKQEKKIPPKEEPHMEYTKHIKRHTLISDQFPASNLIFNYSKTMNSVLSMSKRAEHHKISPWKKKKKGKIETALESRRLNKVCKFQFQEQEKEIYQITDPI